MNTIKSVESSSPAFRKDELPKRQKYSQRTWRFVCYVFQPKRRLRVVWYPFSSPICRGGYTVTLYSPALENLLISQSRVNYKYFIILYRSVDDNRKQRCLSNLECFSIEIEFPCLQIHVEIIFWVLKK